MGKIIFSKPDNASAYRVLSDSKELVPRARKGCLDLDKKKKNRQCSSVPKHELEGIKFASHR